MSTVTGIAEGRVAMLVTVHVFELSHLLGKNRTAKRYFLLSLAKICLLRRCPKKMSGGLGGRSPTHLQNI